MGMSIDRQFSFTAATGYGGVPNTRAVLTNAIATTPEFFMQGFAGGCIYLPANSPITLLSFYGAPWSAQGDWPAGWPQNPGAVAPVPTYYQLFNAAGAETFAPIVTTPPQVWALPTDCFGFASIKIVIAGASSAPVEMSFKG
jgi:hypothetical protein